MNKVYRSVWNEALGAWVAVSEQGAARAKRSGRAKAALVAAALAGTITGASAGGLDGGTASGVNAVSIGPNTSALGGGDIVIGSESSADGNGLNAIVLGVHSTATGENAISIGDKTITSADRAEAFGAHATSTATDSVAVGYGATATQSNAVALGAGSVASTANTVSVGSASLQRTITYVQAGNLSAASTDAVNGSQLYATNSNVAALTSQVGNFQSGSKYLSANDAAGSTAGASASGIGSIALGGNAVANSAGGSDAAVAIGSDSRAIVARSMAIGPAATSSATNSIAIGTYSVADRANSVSVGTTSAQRQIVNVAAGTQDNDVATIAQLKSTGLKLDSLGNATNALVAYDDATLGTITLGGGTAGTAITNLKAGSVGASSTDAVNGSQLFATNQNVAQSAAQLQTVASLLGGGAAINPDGSVKAPAYSANGGTQNTVGGAITALDSGLQDRVKYDTSAHDKVTLGNAGTPVALTNVKAGTLGAVSTDAVNGSQLYDTNQSLATTSANLATTNSNLASLSADAVKYDTAAHDIITFGTAGTPVRLTNVKNAALSSTSSDAVNGAQLYTTNQKVAQNTADISNLSTSFNSLTSNLDTGQVGIVRQDQSTRVITVGGATDGATINVAGTAGPRVVTGVANGAVSATSVDAINGSQLLNASSTIAAALGGGAGVDAKGGVSAPTYNVGGTQVHNVGAAIDNLDGRVTKNTTDIAALQGNLANVSDVASNAVAYDSKDHTKVTLGGPTPADGTAPGAVQLTNVKDGDLSAASTDAVNGRQLNATNAKLDAYAGLVNNFQSAGVDYVAVNSSKEPLPVATGTNAVAIGANSTASGNNSVALGANSVADQDNTVSVGSAGSERRVTNVAPGINGTDAANVNQLNALRNDLGASMTSLQRSAFGGVAAAMAMPNLTPREAGRTIVAAGVGNYKGYSAFGAGATYRSRDGAWLVNGALSVTPHGDTGVRAQVGYEF
jgi:autotransporter adhesin